MVSTLVKSPCLHCNFIQSRLWQLRLSALVILYFILLNGILSLCYREFLLHTNFSRTQHYTLPLFHLPYILFNHPSYYLFSPHLFFFSISSHFFPFPFSFLFFFSKSLFLIFFLFSVSFPSPFFFFFLSPSIFFFFPP